MSVRAATHHQLTALAFALASLAATSTPPNAQAASETPMALDAAVDAFRDICIRAQRTAEDVARALEEAGFSRASNHSTWTTYHESLNASVAFPPEDGGASCSMVFQSTEELSNVRSAFNATFATELQGPGQPIEEGLTVYQVKDASLIAIGPREVAPGLFQIAIAGVLP